MSILLQHLPRQTQYAIRVLSFANELTPILGGPAMRLARLGTRHAIDVSIPALAAASCGAALIADLGRGETETIVIRIPEPGQPPTNYGTPLVNGGNQLGMTLNIDGLPPGTVIRKGKWLSVIISGQRFAYYTTAEVTANGTGQAALPIFPMIRRPAPNNAVVELAEPKLEGFVQKDRSWDVRRIGAIGIDFTITERE